MPISSSCKDIRDIKSDDVAGFDAVVHLAGLSNDPLGDLKPDLTYEINHRATVKLAELAREHGVRRFIFASSCSNYGAGEDDWRDESSPLQPLTPYAKSKVAVESDVGKLAGADFPTFMRNATVFGVSPMMRFDLVLNNLVAWACSAGEVRSKSDGKAWRPLIHVTDVARAVVVLLEAPRNQVHNRTYNVGSNIENYRVIELAKMVTSVVPNSRITHAPYASQDERCYRVDCTRFAEEFPHHQPQVTAAAGAQEVYAALKNASVSPADFEGAGYQRLAHLKMLCYSGQLDPTLRMTRPG